MNSISANPPLVYILIINWNGYNDTIECIDSLKKITYSNHVTVIIDNGSINDYDRLKEYCPPETIIIRSDKNLGFSGGSNLGIGYCMEHNADFILSINNDTVVEPDFLEKLVAISNEDNIAIVAPKILYYDYRNIVWSKGGKISKIGSTGYPRGSGRVSSKFKDNKRVIFVSGCCMLMRTKALKDIGLFDNNYFLYMEDIDLCRRTINKGYAIICVQDSVIYHKVNSSTKRETPFWPIYYITRNRLYFAQKYHPEILLLVKIYMYSTMHLKFIYWHYKGKNKLIKAVKQAFTDFNNKEFGEKENLGANWN